jgi:hypothetical protein
MNRSTILRTGAVGVTCALAGAAAGVAGGSASTSKPLARPARHAWLKLAPDLPLPLPGIAGPPIHSETVVPNEHGGFDTLTADRGMFSSLSGDQLTITEGTRSSTYKTVTLTIPADATVRRNGEVAQLSALRAGDTVAVMRGPDGMLVDAFDAQHEPKLELKVGLPGGPGKDEGPRLQKLGAAPPVPGSPDAGAGPPPG